MKRKLQPKTAAARAFDIRPGAVKKWVAQLPVANLAELGRRLNEALRQANAQPASAGRRAYFLESIGPAATTVLSHLQCRYANQPFPLNAAGNHAARLAMELLTELLGGYRAVLKAIVPEKEEASRWRILWYRRQLVASLHRFIHYGNQMVEIYRVLHMDPPKGTWKRIHRCYYLAEVHGLVSRRVPRFDEARRRTTVGQEYRRTLLSVLLPVGVIPPAQQQEINANLDRWANLLQLRSAMEGTDDQHYLVRLGHDLGPIAIADVEEGVLKSDHTRILETRKLCSTLTRLRVHGGKGSFWRRESDLDLATIGFIHDNWCSSHHRAETRVAVDLPAQVAIGLGALFHLTGGRSAPQEVATGTAYTKITLEPLEESGGNWLGKRKEEDVWKSVYIDPAKQKQASAMPKAAVNTRSEPEYEIVAGRVVNQSFHGLAVRIARDGVRQAAVGMPAAVRSPESDWRVGTVVRMKDQGNNVELGMRVLLRGATPARLRTRDGTRVTPFFDVVVGETLEGRRAIAAPAVSALRSGEPMLEVRGKLFEVRRGSILSQSRYMDAFEFEVLGAEALDALAEAAKVATEAPRPAAGSPTPAVQAASPKPTPPAQTITAEERIQELITKTGLSRSDAEFIVSAELEALRAKNR